MDESLILKVEKFVENYNKIKKDFKWTITIAQQFTALLYTLKDKEFDKVQYINLEDYIKKHTGTFSYYRGYHLSIMSSLLQIEFDNAEGAFESILIIEEKMKEEGFKKSNYLGIAAFTILRSTQVTDWYGRIRKSYRLYEDMKHSHFWLTGRDDYPVAALLSESKKDINLLCDEMEKCYEGLSIEGFTKGNGLQFLSHMLTLSMKPVNEKIESCIGILNYFKENKIKLYSSAYSVIGFLCLLEEYSLKAAEEVVQMYELLKTFKGFKWNSKEINMMFSASLVQQKYVQYVNEQGLIGTAISTSIETLIAAQMAALAAATSATAAAASSASN